MIVLGIADSHESHACVLRDGVLLAAVAEERLSRLKADMGYPRLAIDRALAIAGVAPSEIDLVAFAGRDGNAFMRLYKRSALFSVGDWVAQNREYFRPRMFEGKALTPLDDFRQRRHLRPDVEDDPYYPFVPLAEKADPKDWPALFRRVRTEAAVRQLGIPAERVRFYRHEDCHQIYGVHSAPWRPERALIVTAEGGGDDSSATLSLLENGTPREIWKSNQASLGRLYRNVTLILGMKPSQHEYKVMGLAPHGSDYVGRRSLELFRRVDKVEGHALVRQPDLPDLYFSLRDALEGERFDGIAWGLQTYVEETLCAWIDNACAEFGVGDVLFSGGVAQNIKACKAILDGTRAERLWSGPVAGDGSLGIGAAWLAHVEATGTPPAGLSSVYLGSAHDAAAVRQAAEKEGVAALGTVVERPTPEQAAAWLAAGKVVARFSGRMEFGQRALGNRSILADPRGIATVERINAKIKHRDFWMPFTPSMLDADCPRYLVNPKGIDSPFMTMAFDTTAAAHADLPAALHPADKTARPQMLKRDANPGYYDLIAAFKAKTGVGAVLNTSFNLHGEAIVDSPTDAIDTFRRSELDVLLFDDLAVVRDAP